jgi:hypothetical protein
VSCTINVSIRVVSMRPQPLNGFGVPFHELTYCHMILLDQFVYISFSRHI